METDFITQLTGLVFQSAILALMPLLVAAIVQFVRKLGMDLSASQQAKLQVIAENAVLAAEEWAVSRIKRKIPTPGESKLARAVESILFKVPGVTEDEAKELINAALPKVGLGATDFLTKVRQAQSK